MHATQLIVELALLGLTTGERHALPFEELIEANRLGSVACGAGTW